LLCFTNRSATSDEQTNPDGYSSFKTPTTRDYFKASFQSAAAENIAESTPEKPNVNGPKHGDSAMVPPNWLDHCPKCKACHA
jgi:hypothetical protein